MTRRKRKKSAADSQKNARPSWPPLRGGSARRRWGRELCGGQGYFGPRLAKNACSSPLKLKLHLFRQVCRGRIYASRAGYPLYHMIGTAAAGGIYAAPTSQPILFILVYGRGRGMPRPYTCNRARPPWPPLRGGSARRRWGREPCGGQEHFEFSLPKNLIGLLRPYGWFVGDAYMRPVRVTRYTA